MVSGLLWQRVKDSNPHIQSQSLLCYLYTNPLYLSAVANRYYYTEKQIFVNSFLKNFSKNFSFFNRPSGRRKVPEKSRLFPGLGAAGQPAAPHPHSVAPLPLDKGA